MFSLDRRMIGATWYHVADHQIHMYFLTGSAVSTNHRNWEYLGFALTRREPGEWDDKNLATGGVIYRSGKYWMAYTGHKMDDPILIQRVGMAVSNDLVTWEKLSQNPTSEVDPTN